MVRSTQGNLEAGQLPQGVVRFQHSEFWYPPELASLVEQ